MDADKRLSTNSLGSSRDLRTVEIELRTGLSTAGRDWLLARLMSQSGIEDANFSHAQPSLLIEYDADVATGGEIVNFLYLCGLSAPSAAGH
jgi:hypothetical protein